MLSVTTARRPGEGRDRPRWRAKLRHRLDAAPEPRPEPRRQLDDWIDACAWASAELSTVETLDLTAYLRDTSHIDLPPTERLRMLAVAVEPRMSVADQPRG